MHASEQLRNVRATVINYLAGSTIRGAPTVQDADEPRRASEASPWVRVAVLQDEGAYDGHADAETLAYWTPVIVTCDLFWRSGEAAAGHGLYAIDDAAADLAHALRHKHLPLLDYASNPSAPPTVAGCTLAFRGDAAPRALPLSGPWQRRQVTARGFFHLRHTI